MALKGGPGVLGCMAVVALAHYSGFIVVFDLKKSHLYLNRIVKYGYYRFPFRNMKTPNVVLTTSLTGAFARFKCH